MSTPWVGEGVVVLTTRQVIARTDPVRLVIHDTDGRWMSLCATSEDLGDARQVHVGHLLELDPTLGAMARLPAGTRAYREDVGDSWEMVTLEPLESVGGQELGAVTTRQVLERRQPVRIVIHDQEGDWMFLCGTTEDVDDGIVVGVGHLLELEPELEALLRLPMGMRARRERRGDEWRFEEYVPE